MDISERLAIAVERLNENFERLFPVAEMPTMSRRQVRETLGVSDGTIANYEAKYGSAFKICRNEYSAEFVRAIKKSKEKQLEDEQLEDEQLEDEQD